MKEAKVIKVVLTGGPGGGKTSVLNAIKNLAQVDGKYKNIIKLGDKKIKLITIPETATELISNGITPTESKKVYDFQEALFNIQKAKEENAMNVLKFGYDADIVLFIYDRGLLDGMAYLDTKVDFENILFSNGVQELELLDSYDLVIDLLSTAVCSPDKYSSVSNQSRYEDKKWAKSVDERTTAMWVGHRNMRVFDSSVPLEEEIENVINYLTDYILNGKNNEKESFCIVCSDDAFLKYNDENSRRIHIENMHVSHLSNSYIDTVLTQRVYKNYSSYFLKTIVKENGVERVVNEVKINKNTHQRIINTYGIDSIESMEELSFVEGTEQYRVLFYKDCTLLEVNQKAIDGNIKLPYGVKIIDKNKEKVLKK